MAGAPAGPIPSMGWRRCVVEEAVGEDDRLADGQDDECPSRSLAQRPGGAAPNTYAPPMGRALTVTSRYIV